MSFLQMYDPCGGNMFCLGGVVFSCMACFTGHHFTENSTAAAEKASLKFTENTRVFRRSSVHHY